ncbi:hypothetical protein JTE90_013561 [Oedothorax gibbosus]|uniref:Reverse transcriptase domain-containing protein n=1 Tax=Oedothorax gibbosus TaxID=931172 RepID=A0AAV6THG8_9ARAC|nr:hypothetical protein JTE90_013561 [Oedothorax gibbosus]
MVNARLVYCLEERGALSPFQSGFRHHRSAIDNILILETSIREAFVRNQHLVSIFFDMEKAYDRTWRYGIPKDLGFVAIYLSLFRTSLRPVFSKYVLDPLCLKLLPTRRCPSRQRPPRGVVYIEYQ